MTYYSRHRDKCLEYAKQYREENQERIKEYKAKYKTDPNYKDKEKIYAKKWRDANIDYRKEKIKCDNCGSMISRNGIAEHKKTKKCKEFNTD